MTQLQEIEREFGDIVRERFPEFCRRLPTFRYFRVGDKQFCWTTELATSRHGSHLRYASWRMGKSGKPIAFREHAKRKDAKARALKMYYEAKEKENHD